MTDFIEPGADVPSPPRASNLASLLERSAAGDEEAFAAFYDATASRMYGIAARVLNDEALAVEVTQEAYRLLWTHAAGFDPTRGSALSWILATVHHRAVCQLRSAGTRTSSSQVSPGLPAMAALSSTDREAVELAYLEGHTHADVARLSGVSPGTAQSRIRGGLLTLRDR